MDVSTEERRRKGLPSITSGFGQQSHHWTGVLIKD